MNFNATSSSLEDQSIQKNLFKNIKIRNKQLNIKHDLQHENK
jgi:hypothetical protein